MPDESDTGMEANKAREVDSGSIIKLGSYLRAISYHRRIIQVRIRKSRTRISEGVAVIFLFIREEEDGFNLRNTEEVESADLVTQWLRQ